ncbi:MAG: class I SAM-dependent methyltransferase [Candidatus Methylomirabilales bacterium]
MSMILFAHSSESVLGTPPRACNLCGGRSAVLLQQAEEPYRVVRCEQCTLVYVDPLPGQRRLEEHYDESYYHEWISTQKEEREILWRNRLPEVLRHKKTGRLLDIGCGEGTFIKLAKEAGFEVFGTELSRYAGRRARELYEVPVFVGNVIEAGFPAEYFDVVTLYHVIEHVDDPRRYLSEAYRILKTDGLLIVACPNVESYVFNLAYRCFKRRPVHLFSQHDKEIHLYHFSSRTLSMLLERVGFTVISVGPDDFPVDLRKRVVEWLARGLYQVTERNWTMGLKLLAVKAPYGSVAGRI